MKFPFVSRKAYERQAELVFRHHNVVVVHELCGKASVARNWGVICPVCSGAAK